MNMKTKIFVNEIFYEEPLQLLDSVDDSNRNDNNIQNK
jgi:hypothetical protein